MTIAWIRFTLTAVAIVLGLISFTGAVIGNWRFGFIMNRMHAAGIGDTMALFLVTAGIIISSTSGMDILKLIMLVAFLWTTSPVSSHFLSQLEYYTNPRLDDEVERRDRNGSDGNI